MSWQQHNQPPRTTDPVQLSISLPPMWKTRKLSFPLLPFHRCARWSCLRLGRALFTRLRHRRRLRPHQRLEPMPQASNVASQSSTVVRKPDRAALRHVPRAGPADTKIRVRLGSSRAQALTPAGRVPSILRGQDLPVPVPVVQEVQAHVLALAHVPASALHVPVVLALGQAVLRLQARHRAHRVLRGRRVAVAASSTPRPRKAR
jgi:hypothetical protein